MPQLYNKTERPPPFWLWPNLVGLDSPLVAVSWQWLLARTFNVEIPLVFHLILGLSVWCVYLADRLYDALRMGDIDAATSRHSFTKNHFAKLLCIALLFGAVNTFLILRYLPLDLIINGLIVSALLGIYYLFRFRSKGRLAGLIPREILCGMIFAMGCGLTVFSLGQPSIIGLRFFGAIFSLGLLCSASCILISFWERDADIANGDNSIATTKMEEPKGLGFALGLLILGSIASGFFADWEIHLACALAALALWLMRRFEARLSPNFLRTLADGVLLTPLLVVWFL